MNKRISNTEAMVVGGKYLLDELKQKLIDIGFHKERIFIARDQERAIKGIGHRQDADKDVDLLIFDYSANDKYFDKIVNLSKLDSNEVTKDIPTIVILSKENEEFVKNSEEFKNSKIIFTSFLFSEISKYELENAIKTALKN